MFSDEEVQELAKEILNEDLVQTVKIGKLKDLLHKPQKKTNPENVVEEPVQEQSTAQLKSASQNEIREIIGSIASSLAQKNRKSLSTYLKDPILEIHENIIEFTVGSKTLKSEIEQEERLIFREFNSKGYRAPEINVHIDALKVQEYKPFTAMEQFQAAAKDYPILNDFADRFGLDFDV